MNMDKSRKQIEETLNYVSAYNEDFHSFIQDGFLKNLFDKNPSKPVDNTQLLISKFGEAANPENFSSQAQATKIQPTTLSLIFSIALYVSSRSWETFATKYYMTFGDMGEIAYDEGVTDDGEYESSEDGLDEDEINQIIDNKIGLQTPNPVEDTPPARVTDDKQVKNQSTMANSGAETLAKNPKKDKKSLSPEATQILTGYEAVGEEQERIRDIIVYDIPYTWYLQKILAELKLWGNTIKCSVKRQHKYQTLRVKIALSSFALPQFKNFWTTDLGGIPVRWFPASWTLRERKQREKFQAVIHDIPEDMMMATLWSNRKPCEFLVLSGAHAFKIIQTSKGRRKLVAYFANWETTLMTLEAPPVTLPLGKELKWCRHSIPNLKKAQPKPKTKKTLNKKKSGNTGGNDSVSNKSKKKDKQQSSTKASKNNNELKNLTIQKKAKKSPKNGEGGNKNNKEVLAEILTLLRRLI
ncbi:unnamed protein product [Rhizophagus irregularis]|nr:unnamed protein product [Rhizophagus irregularis]